MSVQESGQGGAVPDADAPPARAARHLTVVHAVQEMIRCGELGPGDRLPIESTLAERLDISRNTLREGVRALVAMGILETRQGSGTTVTPLTPELLLGPLTFWVDIQEDRTTGDLHTVRRALEVESAALAARRRTPADITALRAILRKAEPAIRSRDHEAAMKADLEFHAMLARSGGNTILSALLDSLSQPTLRVRMWQSLHRSERLDATHQEHLSILDAVAAGDVQFASSAMHTHLTQVTMALDANEANNDHP
ncbi:FadR/GntR family transcriptional regulator [Micrococcus luteus]